jgi:hypothetical protein
MTQRSRVRLGLGIASLSCVSLVSCATGFNRGEMEAALHSAKPAYVSSDLSVEQIEALKPQIVLPGRIAIAPPIQVNLRWWGGGSLPTWTREEIAVFESWKEPLREAGIASELLVLPSGLVTECAWQDGACRLRAQRAAAARAGADALLIVTLATATDEYANPISALYLTIIGMWIAPGSHRDALTVVEGALLDNRNEYLYAFARGEGEGRLVRPLMYAETAAAVSASRVAALRDFGTAFIEQARQLRVR